MSTKSWVEVRDSVLEALKLEEVGKGLKDRFVGWVGTEGIEFAQALVDEIKAECKKDAPQEKGWCRIRDTFVVPVSLDIGMAILKLIVEKAAAEEAAQ
jgi:hypothetical protein